MGLFAGTSRAGTLNYNETLQVVVFLCAQVTSRCILPVFLEVKLPQAHPLPSASHFFSLQFHIPLRFRHVCLHLRPPNNPINERAPSLGARLSLFLSY